ncbi:MAG: prolipoprotein diacylglyceryl transferase [Myxococcales bacterium]|nr:prolipoprotein diacylglyceryl transferase [Myxococcales bacterium]
MFPQLFTVPGTEFVVTAYGLLMGLALVGAWVWALLLAREDRLPSDRLGTVFVVATVLGLLGARGVWLLQHGEPLTLEALRSLPAGGMTVFGGAALAFVACAIGARRVGVPLLAWLDCVAPGFMFGAVCERIGALLAGGDFGSYAGPEELGHALAVTYPPGSPAFVLHTGTLQGLPGVSEAASAPVHPVQAYEAAVAMIALIVALRLRRTRTYTGQVFCWVFGVFVAGRALVEPLRHDASPEVLGPLRLAQISGLGLCLVLAIAAAVQRGRAAATPGGLRLWEGGPWSPKP